MAETTTEERPDAGGVRLAIWLVVVGLLVLVNYAGRYLVEAPDDEQMRDVLYRWSTFAAALVQFGFLLVVTLALTAGLSARHVLALRRPRSWPSSVGLAVALFVGTFVVSGIVGALGADPGEEQGLTPEGWDSSRAAPFVANALLVVGFVPVVEELMFRGLGFSLVAQYGAVVAIVVTGLLFALGHGVLLGLPIFAFLGLGLAFMRYRMDSVYPTIAAHAAFNGFALFLALAFGGDS